ncbi:MAG: dephospho-CoA kinase [Victivallales bacterium]|nr:dephospho-CoA kinase [Victivallales bacterium]
MFSLLVIIKSLRGANKNIMILGLTGGFGCGKSSVLKFFKTAGWQTSNTDDICAELYEQQDIELMSQLRDRWQDKVFYSDGKVNKTAIAKIVFNDDKELQCLCSMLYPLIAKKTKALIEQNREKDFIIEVPLLFEAEWDKIFDKTVAVWTDNKTQTERLLAKGFSINDIKNRNSKQLPNDEKLKKADFGLMNNGNLKFLQKQCNKLIKSIKE